ncbi:acyl-CoA synthetase (AMP-forming)/AMP-acid ligase II [Rhodovulum imhoffii]|uniref:Acyl-CoA synthetase (AMP-forming)/AMP-acid ligase II n=1 Tax=Rhodovulum imhoffii TaxID=365340 RepID=A0A2T5BP66_9RHOB|nr:class I adenylate-forming enzyme family protein [Rhodovulum imhoffii]PTN00800.1 acyl-CoA synthetase (AMP-forming)/AMP-acid ligase II [Rhodovulum imhoffii]
MPETLSSPLAEFWHYCAPSELVDLQSGERIAAEAFEIAVSRLAGKLPPPPGRILIRARSPIRILTAIFAVWRSGNTAVIADYSYPEATVARFCDRLCVAAIITDNAIQQYAAPPDRNLMGCETPPALLLATSGTSGAPKWVALTHTGLSARIEANIAFIGHAALDTVFVPLPLSFGHGLIGNALTAIAAGGRLVFDPCAARMPMRLGETLEAQSISFMSSVPSLWETATRLSPSPRLSTPLRVHVGSAPLTTSLVTRIRKWAGPTVSLYNCYGITECSNWIAAAAVDQNYQPGDVGYPFGAQLAIRADNGAIMNSGEGEILVSGPSVMAGYVDAPSESGMALDRGWFHTGDRGSLDGDGRLRLGPRIKDLINVGGIKVDPSEIESALASCPEVATAVAFAVADEITGEAVAVCVVPEHGCRPPIADLRAHLQKYTRRPAWPIRIEIANSIPLTARGKISRTLLRERALEREKERDSHD